MQRNPEKVSASGGVIPLLFLLLNAIVLEHAYVADAGWYKLAYVTVPLLLISLIIFRRKLL